MGPQVDGPRPTALGRLSPITDDWKHPDLARALEFHDRWLPNTMRRIADITRNCRPQCVTLRGPGDRGALPRYR